MENIIGVWRTDLTDELTKSEYGNATMEFTKDGNLIYLVHSSNSVGVYMTYKIEGNTLITDQPSSPKEERTEFNVTGNRLELNFGGVKSKFIRVR
jgi:hypothetical protein